MSTFKLLEGDAYEGRLAEVFITEKHYLVFHCSLCDQKYVAFDELLEHITDQHYATAAQQQQIPETDFVATAENYEQSSLVNSEEEEMIEEIGILLEEDSNITTQQQLEGQLDHVVEQFEGSVCEQEEFISEIAPADPVVEDTNSLSLKTSNSSEEYGCIQKLRSYSRILKTGPDVERKYKCHICGFAFKENYNLRSHLLRHSGRKDYVCAQCSKQFYTLTELETHGRRHTGERPYKCEKCGAGFITSSALGGHMKRHNNERPYKCEFCEKRFFDSGLLKGHLTVHTKERNFQCNICNASFARRKTLIAHMKIHINEREYRCKICEAAFNQQPALYSHIKSKHKFHPNAKRPN